MTENLGTMVDQNSAAIEQMSRSVQIVANSGRQIADAATSAATAAAQMDRSVESVAGLARRADELTRRVSGDAESGGRPSPVPFRASGAYARR